ncbi:hypothetical protein, partial [Staphylococcus epidermidis]|uniref:hypothetical protein n=1 Tax=Staphylococcus epidermidis TaxID=1282 RepID=UPI001CEF83AD
VKLCECLTLLLVSVNLTLIFVIIKVYVGAFLIIINYFELLLHLFIQINKNIHNFEKEKDVK